MAEISKVAVIGAGAVGAYFIEGMLDHPQITLTVVADPDRVRRLRQEGISVNGKDLYPVVKTAEEAGRQDLILVATKYMGLDEAIAMLPDLIGEETLILSLLNGVDSEDRIAAAVGREHVLYSIMRISSQRVGRDIRYYLDQATMGVSYGGDEEKVARIDRLFDKTTILHHARKDIVKDLWIKYGSNIANNLPQAILNVPAALYYRSEHGLFLSKALYDEVRTVAASRGVNLPEGDGVFPGNLVKSRYSTLQDLDAGRPTEIEMLAGNLIRMAAEAGIEVPYTTYTYHCIKALEEKNEGLFD